MRIRDSMCTPRYTKTNPSPRPTKGGLVRVFVRRVGYNHSWRYEGVQYDGIRPYTDDIVKDYT